MRNLDSLGRQSPDALRDFCKAEYDETGNMPEPPGIFPKTRLSVVLMQDGKRVLTMKSWGMPSPLGVSMKALLPSLPCQNVVSR